jgi:hypothetical protein
MTDKGYILPIGVADAASTAIKNINQTLKDLQRTVKDASGATDDATRKDKNRFDGLNKGISVFAKNARTELLALTKNFASVEGKIGKTIETFGKAFDLGGLAIGAGLAIKAVEGIADAYRSAAKEAQSLLQVGARTGLRQGPLQQFQAFTNLAGLNPGDADKMLQSVATWKMQAKQFALDPKIQTLLRLSGADINKDDADTVIYKVLNAARNNRNGLSAAGMFPARIGQALGVEDFDRLVQMPKDMFDRILEDSKNVAIESDKTLDTFRRMDLMVHEWEQVFHNITTDIKNALGSLGPGGALAVGGIGAVGGGLLGGLLVKRLLGGVLGWLGKSLGLASAADVGAATGAAAGATGAEVAAGIGFLAWLGSIAGTGALGAVGGWFAHHLGPEAAGTATGGTYDNPGMTPYGMPSVDETRKALTPPTAPGPNTQLDNIKKAIQLTESANGYNSVPLPGHSATGPMQIMPDTWVQYAHPGERISNPEDNIRVGNRIIDHLAAIYGNDPDKIAYAYANGSITSPDRNPGYVAKFRKNFDSLGTAAPAAVNGLVGAIEGLPEFQRHQQLSNYCARLVNMALTKVGLPPITDKFGHVSNVATDASGWGTGVAPDQGQAGDLGVDMYGHGRGELGGHVGVLTGRKRPDGKGGWEYEFDSSHRLGDAGTGAGTDWRHLDLIRRAPNVAPDPSTVAKQKQDDDNKSSHEVTVSFANMPSGARANVSQASGDANLNLRTRYAMNVV